MNDKDIAHVKRSHYHGWNTASMRLQGLVNPQHGSIRPTISYGCLKPCNHLRIYQIVATNHAVKMSHDDDFFASVNFGTMIQQLIYGDRYSAWNAFYRLHKLKPPLIDSDDVVRQDCV